MRYSLSRRQFMAAGGAATLSATLNIARAATTLDQVSLTFDWVLDGLYAPFFYGIATGVFAKHGIELTLFPGTGSNNTALAIAAGHTTFGMVDATVLPLALTRGVNIKAFCGYLRTSAFGICYKNHIGISHPRDLEGRLYGDSPGSATFALWPIFMRRIGVDPNKVNLVSVSPAAQWGAFFNGQFVATYTAVNDSFVKVTSRGHDVSAFAYADYGMNLMSKSLVAHVDTLKNASLVRRFTAAFIESLEATRLAPDAAVSATRRLAPQSSSPKTQLAMLRDTFKNRINSKNTLGKPLGFMASADWTALTDILTEAGTLKEKIALDRLFTNDYLPA
jgi:NitT/TauT family transport system substrate-binding protein